MEVATKIFTLSTMFTSSSQKPHTFVSNGTGAFVPSIIAQNRGSPTSSRRSVDNALLWHEEELVLTLDIVSNDIVEEFLVLRRSLRRCLH